MNRIIAIGITLMLTSISVFAQVKFYASADRQVMLESDYLVLSVTVENGNLKSFSLPPLKDFKVTGGPSVSNNWSMINGKVSQFKSWSFMLVPVRSGNLTIEALDANIEGSNYKTEEIKIKVTKSPQAISNSTASKGDDYFVVANCNKTSVYLGEPVFVSFKIYTSKNLFDVQFPKSSIFKGFWKYDLPQNENQMWQDETFNGKRYRSIVLQEIILFPQAEGKLEITPLKIKGKVEEQIPLRPRDIFEEFFGRYETKVYDFTMNSNVVKIDVKPLPEKDKPSNFSGLVGSFKVERTVDKDSCEVDDVFKVKHIISGRGNFDVITKPDLLFSEDLETYEPEVTDRYSIKNAGLEGYKTYEFTAIPKQSGIIKIPSTIFSYFDLSKQQYVQIEIPERIVYAFGNSSAPQVLSKQVSKSNEEKFHQIRSLKTLSNKKNSFYSSTSHTLLLVSPLLLIIAVFAGKTLKERSEIDEELGRNKSSKAIREAKLRLKRAKILIGSTSTSEFYAEVNTALMNYCSWKLGIERSQLNKEFLQAELLNRNILQNKVDELFLIIETCEMALYSSQVEKQNPKESVYKKALVMITYLEDKISRKK